MEEEKKDQLLSKEEMEALLSTFSENREPMEASPQPVRRGSDPRPYDFRSPDQYSKEQMRALKMMHESLARRLSSSLSAYLRTPAQVGLDHIEQGNYADFTAHMENPSFIAILSLSPLPGRIFLSTDLGTVSAIIDRLLGGPGTARVRSQEITEIELALIDDVINIFTEALQSSWRNMIKLGPRLEDINLNPQLVQIGLPADVAVMAVFSLSFREMESSLSVCIPYSVLKPIAFKLSPYAWVESITETQQSRPPQRHSGLGEHLRRVPIPVYVRLGTAEIGLEGLMNLQPGDVICLDACTWHKLTVFVGDKPKFLARAGQIGSHLAVQITNLLAENGGISEEAS